MNSHAVFIYLAGFKVDRLAAYPTQIGVPEVRILHVAPLNKRADCKLDGRGQICET